MNVNEREANIDCWSPTEVAEYLTKFKVKEAIETAVAIAVEENASNPLISIAATIKQLANKWS